MPTKILRTTSFTRPLSPATGEMYFETDTKNFIIYDGTGWRIYEDDDTTANTLSLEFDGNDRLDTTYSMTNVQSFTVMFWMKSTDTTNYMTLLADTDTSNPPVRGNLELLRASAYPGHYIIFATNSSDPGKVDNNAKIVGNFNALCDGEWHHIAYVFDSSGIYTNVKIYEDGGDTNGNPQVDEDARLANGWTNDNKTYGSGSADFAFGQRRDNSYPYYNGKMDQMAFFESALSSTDISNIYNDGNGGDLLALGFSPDAYYRVGYYAEDTNSDASRALAGEDIGTVADYSTNNNDASQATLSKKPSYIADTPWS